MKTASKTLLGTLLPIYCAVLLVGCMYLANDNSKLNKVVHGSALLSMPDDKISMVPPPDFKAIKLAKERKQAFIEFFLPIIQAENQRHRKLREQIEIFSKSYSNDYENAPEHDRKIILEIAEEFNVKQTKIPDILPVLKTRVQPIPNAMVLAQAAIESAWGTSRFAREGYNYFGQWCFSYGCGLVPKRRANNAQHEVALFRSPAYSVRSYFNNINSFSAYKQLRQIRADKLAKGENATALDLVSGLQKYSERGEHYVKELKSIIRVNNLDNYDKR